MDVTPRPAPAPARRRNPLAVIALVAILAALAVVVFQGLGNATLYYYNADEAIAQKADLGDQRFRVQGEVQDDVVETDGTVTFTIAFGGVTVPVRHVGDPPDLFQPGLPVVLEGRWDGDVFASDRILVKHSPEYKAENPDRVGEEAP